MANIISISHFTLYAFTYLLLIFSSTVVLSSFSNLLSFSKLLLSFGIAAELSRRNSLTLLAVPKSQFSSASVDLMRRLPPSTLAYLLRFHVLLQFLFDSNLYRLPPSCSTVTTLYEASGRVFYGSESVNVTCDPASGSVTIGSPNTKNVTVLKLLETKPLNIIVLSVDSFTISTGIDLMN